LLPDSSRTGHQGDLRKPAGTKGQSRLFPTVLMPEKGVQLHQENLPNPAPDTNLWSVANKLRRNDLGL
jgi:hypothetical protein